MIHVHVFYAELFDELADVIDHIKLPKKIVITYVDKNINKNLFLQRFPDADVRLVDNVGYDIKPFLDVIDTVNLDKFTYVLKLHTKRNYGGNLINYRLQNGVCVGGTKWRDYLLEPFLSKNWNETLNILRMCKTGAVGSGNCLLSVDQDHPYYALTVKNLTEKFGLKYTPYKFFAGTMFMVKASLLKILCNKQNIVSFTRSDEVRDWHGDAYILERVFGEVVIAQNKQIVGTEKV